MKKNFLIFFVFIFIYHSSGLVAQVKRTEGMDFRLKMNIAPYMKFTPMADKPGLLAGIGAAIVFEEKVLLGVYAEKKVNRVYTKYEQDPNLKLDINYQHFGFWIGSAVSLGLRYSNGRYIKRKTKLFYDVKVGGGTFWMDNDNKEKVSCRDYFYCINPNIGFTRPIEDHIEFDIGFNYCQVFRVGKLGEYVSNSDFSGIGGFIGFRFSLFTAPSGI